MLLHRHHKIPFHAGGKDVPSNIEQLTPKQHAEAHRQLYLKYGRMEDKIAWQGFAGMIGKEEIIEQIQLLAASKGGIASGGGFRGKTHSEKSKHLISIHNKGKQSFLGHRHNADSIARMRSTRAGKQIGKLNSQFGTRWITDDSSTKKIFRSDSIPRGWRPGRVAERLNAALC